MEQKQVPTTGIHKTFPKYEVLLNEEIAEQMYRLILHVDGDFGPYSPGQFLHVKVTDSTQHVLRRPISLCEYRGASNQLHLVYRAGGAGTRLLSQKRRGDVLDIIGPLGHGFERMEHLTASQSAHLLIAGGIGVPPMVELAKQLTQNGERVTSIIGFQSHNQVILTEELRQYGEVHVMTNDGSYGDQGFVTDCLTDEVVGAHSTYYACGPTPMLRAVQMKLRGKIAGYLSLEERMGCGIGLCAACVHQIELPNGEIEYAKVCRKGPVFKESEVLFS